MSIEPVRKHVIVEATPERAFRIFTENTKWWPRDHHIGKGALDDRGHSPQLGRFRGVVGNHAAVKRKTHLSLRAERGIRTGGHCHSERSEESPASGRQSSLRGGFLAVFAARNDRA